MRTHFIHKRLQRSKPKSTYATTPRESPSPPLPPLHPLEFAKVKYRFSSLKDVYRRPTPISLPKPRPPWFTHKLGPKRLVIHVAIRFRLLRLPPHMPEVAPDRQHHRHDDETEDAARGPADDAAAVAVVGLLAEVGAVDGAADDVFGAGDVGEVGAGCGYVLGAVEGECAGFVA